MTFADISVYHYIKTFLLHSQFFRDEISLITNFNAFRAIKKIHGM